MESSPANAKDPEPQPNDSSQELSATEKVINTVELLDQILEHVPLKQIFVLQRVNQAFHNHVRGETRTAQRLHLTPRLHGEQKVYPAFIEKASNNYLGPVEMDYALGRVARWKLFNVVRKPKRKAPRSSWEDVLVVQPPIPNTNIWSGGEIVLTVAAPSGRAGVTLGSIYDQVEKKLFKGFGVAVVYMRGDKKSLEVSWKEGLRAWRNSYKLKGSEAEAVVGQG